MILKVVNLNETAEGKHLLESLRAAEKALEQATKVLDYESLRHRTVRQNIFESLMPDDWKKDYATEKEYQNYARTRYTGRRRMDISPDGFAIFQYVDSD